jgi:hypothetical protein
MGGKDGEIQASRAMYQPNARIVEAKETRICPDCRVCRRELVLVGTDPL